MNLTWILCGVAILVAKRWGCLLQCAEVIDRTSISIFVSLYGVTLFAVLQAYNYMWIDILWYTMPLLCIIAYLINLPHHHSPHFFFQEQIGFLLDELFDETNLEALARHPFANFVVQHIFEHGMPERKGRCFQLLLPYAPWQFFQIESKGRDAQGDISESNVNLILFVQTHGIL